MKIPFDRRIKPQAAAFDDDKAELLFYQGGLGCGKTALLAYKILKLSWLNRNIAGGILSPSLPEYKRDLLPTLEEIVAAHVPGAKWMSAGKYAAHWTFPWSKAPVFVFSGEARLKGPNIGWGVVSEHSSIQLQRIREMLQRKRVRNTPVPQLVFGGTPEDDFGWLDEFFTANRERIALYTASSFDNPFLADGYAQTLLENLDEEAVQVYIYGKPANRLAKDAFFYSYKPEVNDWDGAEYIKGETVHAAVDFNVSRMSATFSHVIGEGRGKQIVAFDEMVLTNIGADTEQLGQAIADKYGIRDVLITCDASGKNRRTSGRSDVSILERLGFKVRHSTANPRIRRSQLIMNGLLAKRRLLLHPVKCRGLKKDLTKVRQKADFELDKTNPDLTHLSDGWRYLVQHEFPDWLATDTRANFAMGHLGGVIK